MSSSNVNEESESSANIPSSNVNEGFDFYLRFVKPLVLNLLEPGDRVLAAAWVKKLKEIPVSEEKLRTDYLKLLLFALQKRRLLGPFTKNPSEFEQLEALPIAAGLRDIAKAWLEAEENKRRRRILQGLGSGDNPPVKAECSGDLLEYAATQEIPHFGVHAFYALSKDPVLNWDNVEKGVFPKGVVTGARRSDTSIEYAASQKSEARARSRSRSRSRSRASESDVSEKERTGAEAPTTEEGAKTGMLGSPVPVEERVPPSWGSNLISAGDPVTIKTSPEAPSNPVQSLFEKISQQYSLIMGEDATKKGQFFDPKKIIPPREITVARGEGFPTVPSGAEDFGGAQTLDEMYAELDKRYPQRRKDMPRTPPIFSKHEKIREYGARGMEYRPEEFGVSDKEEWKPGEEFWKPGEKFPSDYPSPQEDPRMKSRARPFHEVFPTIKDDEYESQIFAEDIELVDDDFTFIPTPRSKQLQDRLQTIIGEIEHIVEEVPAVGGVAVTTPSTSPFPMKGSEYWDMLDVEKPPEGFYSPPKSPRAETQRIYDAARRQREMLYEESPKQPSPVEEEVSIPKEPSPMDFGLPEVIQLPPVYETYGKQQVTSVLKGPSPREISVSKEIVEEATGGDLELLGLDKETYRETIKRPGGRGRILPSKDKQPSRRRLEFGQGTEIQEIPEDLMGQLAPVTFSQKKTLLDTSIPGQLPTPVKPISHFPGWRTPPELKTAEVRTAKKYTYPARTDKEVMQAMQPVQGIMETPPGIREMLQTPPEMRTPVMRPPRPDLFRSSPSPFEALEMESPPPFEDVEMEQPALPIRRKSPVSPPYFPSPPKFQERPPIKLREPSPTPDLVTQGPLTRKQDYFVRQFRDPEQQELMTRLLRLVEDVGDPFLDSPEKYPEHYELFEQPDTRERWETSPVTGILDTSPPEGFAQYSPEAQAEYGAEISPRASAGLPQTRAISPEAYAPPSKPQMDPYEIAARQYATLLASSPESRRPSPPYADLLDTSPPEGFDYLPLSPQEAAAPRYTPPQVGRVPSPRREEVLSGYDVGYSREAFDIIGAPPVENIFDVTPPEGFDSEFARGYSPMKQIQEPVVERARARTPSPLRQVPSRTEKVQKTIIKSPTGDSTSPAMRVEIKETRSILDTSVPEGLPSPARPPTAVPGWATPEHLRAKKKTPEKYEFVPKMEYLLHGLPQMESPPPEYYDVPEMDEQPEEEYFPLPTEMPGFLPSPPVTRPSPVKEFLPQSPRKYPKSPQYVKTVTSITTMNVPSPSAGLPQTRAISPEAYAPPSIPQMDPYEIAARQYATLLASSPESRTPSPPKQQPGMDPREMARLQYEYLLSLEDKPIRVSKPKKRSPVPRERIPTRKEMPEMIEDMEFDFERELVVPLTPPSPARRMQEAQEYFESLKYGLYSPPKIREELVKKRKKPGLADVREAREPPDEYKYWPGRYVPPPRSPTTEGIAEMRRTLKEGAYEQPQFRKRKKLIKKGRRPRMERIGETYLEPSDTYRHGQDRKSFYERIEELIADVPEPALARPEGRPWKPTEFHSPERQFPPQMIKQMRREEFLTDEEAPGEVAGYVSPRHRRPSQEYVEEEITEDVYEGIPPLEGYLDESPPYVPQYGSPIEKEVEPWDIAGPSDEYRAPMPDVPYEYPDFRHIQSEEDFADYPEEPVRRPPVPPRRARSPDVESPEAIRRKIETHEYTEHRGDKFKKHMQKKIYDRGKLRPLASKRPQLSPVVEFDEPKATRTPRRPVMIKEETLVQIEELRPEEKAMVAVLKKAAEQYAMLEAAMKKPMSVPASVDAEQVEEDIEINLMDRGIDRRELAKLPPAMADRQLDFVSPPKQQFKMPARYRHPQEHLLSPPRRRMEFPAPPPHEDAAWTEQITPPEEMKDLPPLGSPIDSPSFFRKYVQYKRSTAPPPAHQYAKKAFKPQLRPIRDAQEPPLVRPMRTLEEVSPPKFAESPKKLPAGREVYGFEPGFFGAPQAPKIDRVVRRPIRGVPPLEWPEVDDTSFEKLMASKPQGPSEALKFRASVMKHEYTQGYRDPTRPRAQRAAPARGRPVPVRTSWQPTLEDVVEPREPIAAPRLGPPVYPSHRPPRSAERYRPPILPEVKRLPPMRVMQPRGRDPAATPKRSDYYEMYEDEMIEYGPPAPPRRRLEYTEEQRSPIEPIRESPSMTSTRTETITYGADGRPVREMVDEVFTYGERSPEESGSPWYPWRVRRDAPIEGAFGGQTSPGILDTSDIPPETEEDADFAWIPKRRR